VIVKEWGGIQEVVDRIICGDAAEIIKKFPSNFVDAVVTDPPYGLEFMNQDWDKEVPPTEFWKEVLRVMKPGAHLLCFFGTRTYHRGVVNIENAGFEVRDMILWIYGSGFPKGQAIDKLIDKELGAYDERETIGCKEYTNQDIRGNAWNSLEAMQREKLRLPITEPATPEAKKWKGWNTALKPACEPIILARKPISEKNIAQNVLKWGTGGLNIDACRIPLQGEKLHFSKHSPSQIYSGGWRVCRRDANSLGRFPANVILDEEAAKILDKQSGYSSGRAGWSIHRAGKQGYGGNVRDFLTWNYGDLGGASRFFYCAKAGRDERFAYCRDCSKVIPQKEWQKHKGHDLVFHTTVKPLKLVEYLVRLVTPPGGIVLDPFFGSGTTGIACLKQGFKFIGIEIDETYCKIAEARLKPFMEQKTLGQFL